MSQAAPWHLGLPLPSPDNLAHFQGKHSQKKRGQMTVLPLGPCTPRAALQVPNSLSVNSEKQQ